jgi:beta-xylosidase
VPRALTRRTALLLTGCLVATACSGTDPETDGAPTTRDPHATGTTTDTTSGTTAAPTRDPVDEPAPIALTFPTSDPVWPGDFPDPFLLEVDGEHLAFATQGGLRSVQRIRSDDLVTWDDLGDALPVLPPWVAPLSTWAPAVLPRGDRFLLFYAALVDGTDRHCIGVAISEDAAGPYADTADRPLVCPHDQGGAIDPSPFVDTDGSAWLLWKNDGITLRRESSIWAQPLADDGRSLAGPAVRLIDTDQDWEYPHVEAPSMAVVDGTYWLAYSGSWWNQAAYGVGLARCEGPGGPCTKPLDGPVLASRPGAQGPGGLEFFPTAGGRLLAAYHAWPEVPGYPGSRALWIDEVDTSGDIPVIRPGS